MTKRLNPNPLDQAYAELIIFELIYLTCILQNLFMTALFKDNIIYINVQ